MAKSLGPINQHKGMAMGKGVAAPPKAAPSKNLKRGGSAGKKC